MKYNWGIIQADYDSGLSLRDLRSKYGMSSRTLTIAVRENNLITRSKSQATKICKRKPTVHSEKFKQKCRELINKRYENGWMPKAGRCKKISYYSPIAGFVSLDGTWELVAAQYFDRVGYTWQRNTKRFKYLDQGKERYYTPDFWVDELASYVEIKGYETNLDQLKWSQFPETLMVWKKDKIAQISAS